LFSGALIIGVTISIPLLGVVVAVITVIVIGGCIHQWRKKKRKGEVPVSCAIFLIPVSLAYCIATPPVCVANKHLWYACSNEFVYFQKNYAMFM